MQRVFAPFVVALLLASPLAAQSGSLRGRITDTTGAALARVTITIDGSGLRAYSDDRGDYLISGVPSGNRTVRARLIGFVPQSAEVSVPAGGEARRDFRLAAQPIGVAGIDAVLGSRARHSAADELAVPVDVFTAEQIAAQGSSETSQILQALSPSVNFPRQSVTDATDIVRPFTLRGLSPDHTLVLMNGWRRHQTAVVNTFAYGTGAGSSGVDLNAIPSSAIERVEVLRDGASAQYGSDAIAGVVNIVTREAPFAPFINASAGTHFSSPYPKDGTTVNVNGGWGTRLGTRGSLALFGEVLSREATNRAWADPFDDSGGAPDVVGPDGQVITKNNPVPQPNHHWGDGMERDILTLANLRMPLAADGTSEFYAFGGLSRRTGNGNGYRRYASSARNWPEIYALGFLPEFRPDVMDYNATAGYRALMRAWNVEFGLSLGHNDFEYNLRNTLNTSLGPSTTVATAPGDDGIFGNADDPGIPNQTSFFAGRVSRDEMSVALNASRQLNLGLSRPANIAVGLALRSESFQIERGELASYIDGGHLAQDSSDASGGSQVFPGFAPSDEADEERKNIGGYVDLEGYLSPQLLVAVAGRFESYSDFGERLTGKLALRFQPSRRVTLRAAGSTGFRAPGLGQSHFSKVVTNVIGGVVEEIGVYPVGHPASVLLGATPLKDETSVNLSAGLALSPSDRLTITADVYRITINDRILLGATFDDAFTQNLLATNGFTGIAGVQYFTNGLDTRSQGVDLGATLRTGRLEWVANFNYGKNEITRIDPLPAAMAGSSEPGIIDSVTYIAITEERPEMRATLTSTYATGNLRLLVRGSYYGEFSSAQPGFCDLCRERYGAKTLFDAEVGYQLGRFSLALGARNLLDTYPDQPSSTVDLGGGTLVRDFNNNFGTFPWAAASPFGYNGRYLYVKVGSVF